MARLEIPSQDYTTPDSLFQMLFSFQKPRVLLTAFELGVFTAIGDGSKTSSEVAKALNSAERSTDRLMNALCAMGLLTKSHGQFANSLLAARFLVKGKPDYMAGMGHAVHLWQSWSTLTGAVRRGAAVYDAGFDAKGDDWLAPFIAAMHARAVRMADGVVARIDLGGVSRVLDVGGGSGAYAVAFARAREGLRATVLDLPKVVPLTRGYIEAAGASDKVDAVVGDCNKDSLGSGYDLVFMSALIHSNSFEENRLLIKKAADALTANGQVVIQDFIMDEDRTSPAFAALFALNMLVGTAAGDTYTEFEVRGWLEAAGLSDIARVDTDFETTLIIGRKAK